MERLRAFNASPVDVHPSCTTCRFCSGTGQNKKRKTLVVALTVSDCPASSYLAALDSGETLVNHAFVKQGGNGDKEKTEPCSLVLLPVRSIAHSGPRLLWPEPSGEATTLSRLLGATPRVDARHQELRIAVLEIKRYARSRRPLAVQTLSASVAMAENYSNAGIDVKD